MKDKITLSPAPVFFAFNTITKSQYNNTKIKNLLVDFNTLIKSTNRLSQLKTLLKINNKIKINNSKAGLANFIFDISNTVILRHINLDILIKLVIICIEFVNMTFFFYLANIDKLNIFFNNITNELVYNNFIYLIICKYGYVFLIWYTFT